MDILLHSSSFGHIYLNAEHCHIVLNIRDATDAE